MICTPIPGYLKMGGIDFDVPAAHLIILSRARPDVVDLNQLPRDVLSRYSKKSPILFPVGRSTAARLSDIRINPSLRPSFARTPPEAPSALMERRNAFSIKGARG
jgi:hypothetical protein